MSKEWAGKTVLGLAIYMILFVLTLSYASSVADYFDGTLQGEVSNDVDLETALTPDSKCDFPRYYYNSEGDATKYIFDKNNLDCDQSAGAISSFTCEYIEGCSWNVSVCEGQINLTYYNDGNSTSEDVCDIAGLQGAENFEECGLLGCTYLEYNQDTSDISSTSQVMATLGDLFSFRYDFGFEDSFYIFVTNFIFFYLPLLVLIMCLYILSPFSN